MTRNLLIFFATFVAGATLALLGRAVMFEPGVGHEGHPVGAGDYAAMVSNPLVPAKAPAPTHDPRLPPAAATTKPPTADPHAHHGATSATPTAPAAGQPVNTVCAICGMAVDPKLGTVEYQGKTIGFGCRMCRPKFEAEPDRYGPAYLKNEVLRP